MKNSESVQFKKGGRTSPFRPNIPFVTWGDPLKRKGNTWFTSIEYVPWTSLIILLIIQFFFPFSLFAQGGTYTPNLDKALAKMNLAKWNEVFKSAKAPHKRFRVQDLQEFIKIHEWYSSFKNDGIVTHTFQTEHGEDIQCVEIKSQASIVATGQDPNNIPRSPKILPMSPGIGHTESQHSQTAGTDGPLDKNGKKRQCPENSFPKLIPSIDTFYTYRTFNEIFNKYPVKGYSKSIPPEDKDAETVKHDYAHAARYYYDNQGLSADFNLWLPKVERDTEFSLSQLWVFRGSDAELQTVETGWQVYPGLYGNYQANLFIFSRSSDTDKCYNLLCGRFVQTNSSVIIGGKVPKYSTSGGQQYSINLAFYRDQGGGHHWWLKVNGSWVGYFPNRLFNIEGLAEKSAHLDFGGEIIDSYSGNLNTKTDMGSGRFPFEGFGYAAYIKKCRYYDMSGRSYHASGLTGQATLPGLWDIGNISYSSNEQWGTYFFFGGPGEQSRDFSWILLMPVLSRSLVAE